MSRLIDIIEQIETNVTNTIPFVPLTAKDYVRYLRKFIHPDDYTKFSWKWYGSIPYLKPSLTKKVYWDQVCGQFSALPMPEDALTSDERDDLAKMIIHGNNKTTGMETGVVLTERSGTVAAGHVITGISCGGFNRDTQLSFAEWKRDTSSHLDNLFFVTISGDMGQTSLLFYSHNSSTHRLFGPSGQWDDLSCPKMYSLNPPVSELTEAEVNGDMDGVILGTLIPMIKDRHWKLSRIFRDYYQNGGIQVGNRWFSAANRAETFGELVSDVELEAQSKAFAQAYYPSHKNDYNNISLPSLLPWVHEAVQKFYAEHVPCTHALKTKYTIKYFIEIVKELENEKGLGVVDMTRTIAGVSEYFKSSHLRIMLDVRSGPEYTDHFAWYLLREMVTHGFSPSEPARELGVIEAGGDVVAIGHVLAGIHAGTDRNTHIAQKSNYYKADTLYGATVAGSLAQAVVNKHTARTKTSDTMGGTGTWDRSRCPPKYLLKKSMKSGQHTTLAELLKSMKSGQHKARVELLKSIKLGQHTTRAELLGDIDGFVLGERVSVWLQRDPTLKLSEVLERYYGTGINDVSKDVRFDQFQVLSHGKDKVIEQTRLVCKDIQRKAAEFCQKFFFHDNSFCKECAEKAVNKFYKSVLQTSGKYYVNTK